MPDQACSFLLPRIRFQPTGRVVRRAIRRDPERLEKRCLLAADPIQFGAVYTEQDLGRDAHPDTIEITFVGGAPDTQLNEVRIDADKFAPGLSLADLLFDTTDAGLGVDLPFLPQIKPLQGDFTAEWQVEDGSSLLILSLRNFTAGDRLVIEVDVDEVQGFELAGLDDAAINAELDPITSGAEFQGTLLTGAFFAPHFYDATIAAEFRNAYDPTLNATDLVLPTDDQFENRDRTAGAVGQTEQQPLPVSISGFVFEDLEADLSFDTNDPRLAEVELSLYQWLDEAYVDTGIRRQTNAEGFYEFETALGLMPGTYQIRETQPDGYFSVGAMVGDVGDESSRQPSGEAASPDLLTGIEIPLGGTQATRYNFAEARTGSIGGRIHLSTREGDCFSDLVEHDPVTGATVRLIDEQGNEVATTTTDAAGEYRFEGIVPGHYSVVTTTLDHLIDGGVQVGNVEGDQRGIAGTDRIDDIRLFSGEDAREYEFCDHRPAELRGVVYHDRNVDGLRQVGEEGIGGAILRLIDEFDEIVQSVETDDDGRYEFTDVRAGNYRVIELQPATYRDGTDRAGTVAGNPVGRAINPGDQIAEIMLLWGDQAIDYDFGEFRNASLSGTVHLSTPDGDCFEVADDLLEPVANAIVQLLDTNGQVIAEATTDENGDYEFQDLSPGEYGIREITPAGLIDGGSQIGRVVDMPNGELTSGGEVVKITLQSDQHGVDYDFCEHEPASLSGFVFSDLDNDGQHDANESPIADVVIQLLDDQGRVVMETTTDADGQYQFQGIVRGSYSIRQIQPNGWLDGLDQAGTIDGQQRGSAINPGDQIIDIGIGWSETGIEFNFGELAPATIEGYVHSSALDDCWNDPEATPLSGVTIWLLDSDGTILDETTTDAAGRYRFGNLRPGEYSIEQQQPTTHFQGTQRAGSGGGDATIDDLIRAIPLSAGQQLIDYDFCEAPASRLSGFVFIDGEPIELAPDEALPEDVSPLRDGILTPDDTPLPGVVMELRDGINGTPILGNVALPGTWPELDPIRTATDENGYYEFAHIPKGNYAIYQLHPDSYNDGFDTAGTTDGIPINPLPAGETSIFLDTVIRSLQEPPRNDAIARIGLPPGVHSQLNNFSEVVTRIVEPPAPPSIPTIFDPPVPTTPPPTAPPQLPALYQVARALPEIGRPDEPVRFDGGSDDPQNAWHLSVIDAGQPRVANAHLHPEMTISAATWSARQMRQAEWRFAAAEDAQQLAASVFYFGTAGSVPVTGDWNGDGRTNLGIFVDGHWYLDLNGNGQWDEGDLWAQLGDAGDLPVTGDWDGDGKDDIGVYGQIWPHDIDAALREPGLPDAQNQPTAIPKNMPPRESRVAGQRAMQRTADGMMRSDVIDHVFLFGKPQHHAVAGDWNGDGIDTVGLFHNGVWKLDVDGNGRWSSIDRRVEFGQAGDLPIVADFNGDGIDELAVFRDGMVYIDSNRNRRLDADDVAIRIAEPGSEGRPVVGRWMAEAAERLGWFEILPENQQPVVASRAGDLRE